MLRPDPARRAPTATDRPGQSPAGERGFALIVALMVLHQQHHQRDDQSESPLTRRALPGAVGRSWSPPGGIGAKHVHGLLKWWPAVSCKRTASGSSARQAGGLSLARLARGTQ